MQDGGGGGGGGGGDRARGADLTITRLIND